jgi:MinD superfamily P-loop ATPase
MREIVIVSGKGGTGKSSLSASFAYLEKDNALINDCDVDAANLHLLLDADFEESSEFFSGKLAVIDKKQCLNCGACLRACKFDAITKEDNKLIIDAILCEGCGYCSRICPTEAISMKEQKAGNLYISNIKTGSKLVHAKLGFGAENSGKLVSKVKKEGKVLALKQNKEFVITDGSPGIGCPVISSLSGANLVVIVTEASKSGFHDLQRVVELVKSFELEAVCIINKYDLNNELSQEIEKYLKRKKIKVVSKLPYNEIFSEALVCSQSLVEFDKDCEISKLINESWNEIKWIIRRQNNENSFYSNK